MYNEKDFIQLSAIQHYKFCQRQFYLAYVEEVWIENYLTASGRIMHQHVDDVHKEKRKNFIQEFGLALCSYELGVSGQADVVDFYFDEAGYVSRIIPVEYKRGTEKDNNCDSLQLCAQAMCLEEMTVINIPYGYLFYGKERRRMNVQFSDDLRSETRKAFTDIHLFFNSISEPPKAVYSKKCRACSFFEYCKPKTIGKKKSAVSFLERIINEVHPA